MSAVALLDVDGANRQAQEMLRLAALGREAWVQRKEQEAARPAASPSDAEHSRVGAAGLHKFSDAEVIMPCIRNAEESGIQEMAGAQDASLSSSMTQANDASLGNGKAARLQAFQAVSHPAPRMALNPTACAFIPGWKPE